MKIGAIGFDWYGVIAQAPGKSFSDEASRFLEVRYEDFQRAYFCYNHIVNKRKDVNGYGEAIEMWRAILKDIGQEHRLNDFMEFIHSRPKAIINQDMVDMIKDLRQAGWKLGLFSNNSLEGAREFRQLGYDELFDASLFSAEVGSMKPEPEAFMKLAAALDVPISDLVFIDDSEHSLSTASEVGYTPILFKDIETLKVKLRAMGIDW